MGKVTLVEVLKEKYDEGVSLLRDTSIGSEKYNLVLHHIERTSTALIQIAQMQHQIKQTNDEKTKTKKKEGKE